MKLEDIRIDKGENAFQNAGIERNEKTIDYETSENLNYSDIISISKGLDIISEFYDVKAAASTTGSGICAVSLGKTLEESITNVMDSNPIDFMSSVITLSNEVDSDIANILKNANKVVAPKFTKNASEIFKTHNVCYVTINTPLKEYKNHLMNEIKQTPLGTLVQAPNTKELDKDTFKVVTTTKPTVEQIEDAVFAWKVAKHANSQAIVIAKDLKTTAVAQGLQSASVEYALDYSCDMSKEAVLASDMPITVHDLNVAAQGRISLIIVPFADKGLIDTANKFNMSIITTGFTNISY